MAATTPDGILERDWSRVHALAVALANASDTEDPGIRRELLACLEDLEQRYGPRPSILATRADYCEDPLQALALLQEAYRLASLLGDTLTALNSSTSLAELYVDEFRDAAEGERWLAVARGLLEAGNKFDAQECDEIQDRLQALKAGV